MAIHAKDFDERPQPDALALATEAANAWLAENPVSVISIETTYVDGYFAKVGGIRVWYHEAEPDAAA